MIHAGQIERMTKNNFTYPFLSILVAVKNEEKYIERTLDMLFEQDYPKDKFEVIVADGLSDDKTREIVGAFTAKHENCTLVNNDKVLSASGWNLGIEKSRGDVVSFLSGHVNFSRDYYRKLVKRLDNDMAGVGGPSFTKGEGTRGKIISLAYLSIFGSGGASFLSDSIEGHVETIVFGCYWKKDIQKAGGFDENCFRGQDWDLNVRLRSLGYFLYKVNDVKTEHFVRDSFKSLWKRHYNAGLWKVYINRKYENSFLVRHLIPPVFSFGLTAAVIASLFWCVLLLIPALVLLCYLMLSLQMTIKYDLKFYNIFIFTLVFFIIHYSYGLGFIFGLGKQEKKF